MGQTTHSRALGAIWSTCVADALGGPVQFMKPNTFPRVTGLGYIEKYRKPAGSFSDDGSMTLALAKSFIDSGGTYNQTLAIQYWTQWNTRQSLLIWKRHGLDDVEATQRLVDTKLEKEERSGNGSLMRVSPVGVALFRDADAARRVARVQSVPTHPCLACVESCEAFTLLVCKAMNGETKEQICESPCNFPFTHPALASRFAQYKNMNDFAVRSRSDVQSTGWVVDTLKVALWAFFKYDSWADCVLAVVNLGGDSDTAGTVCGGLCGVYYGIDSIPEGWRMGMMNLPLIIGISDGFADLVSSQPGTGQ